MKWASVHNSRCESQKRATAKLQQQHLEKKVYHTRVAARAAGHFHFFFRGAQKLVAAALWVILDPRLRLYTAGRNHHRPFPSEAVLNQGTVRIHLLCSRDARLPDLCIMKRMNIAYIYACCLMLRQTCCAFTIVVCLMENVD